MTGTAAGEREFTSVYGLPVTVVPLRTPCRRVLLHEHFTGALLLKKSLTLQMPPRA